MKNEEVEVIQKLIAWHCNQVKNLKMITDDHDDADIVLGDDLVIKSGSDMHKGVQIGVEIALSFIGELPIKLHKNKN